MSCFEDAKRVKEELIKNNIDFYFEMLKDRFKTINTEEYCLAYSGGRDSHFLYWFIKNILKDDKITIISVNTKMEHQEIRERMYKYADVVLMPTMSHADIKAKYGSPCFTKFQDEYIERYQKGNRTPHTMKIVNRENKFFKLNKTAQRLLLIDKLHKISNKCCDYLKKQPMNNYLKKHKKKYITGMRTSEGILRAFKTEKPNAKNKSFSPIFDLTDEMLVKIEKKYNIEVPEVYDTLTRTGCMGCPYGRNIEQELSVLTPAQQKFCKSYFKESYNVKNVLKQRKL